MNRVVSLFLVPGMSDNALALEEMKKLPGQPPEVVTCPQSMRESYVFPFVKDEEDSSYYGLNGVRLFVSRRLIALGERIQLFPPWGELR